MTQLDNKRTLTEPIIRYQTVTRTTEEISTPGKVRKTYASLSRWKRKKIN